MRLTRYDLVAALAGCAVLAFCTPQAAPAQTVGLHIGSQHWPQKDYTNSNPGLYYRAQGGFTIGAYRNSERHLGVYLGQTYEGRYGPFRAAATLGVVYGYERTPMLPMLIPSVAFDMTKGCRVRLAVIPAVTKKQSSVAHAMAECDL